MKKKFSIRIFNAWEIKLVLVVLMVLNHLEFVYGLYPESMQSFGVYISRGVAPMFAYLAVAGIMHTKNLRRFCFRLWLWSGIVFVGNIILSKILISNAGSISAENLMYLTVRTNICVTLAAGVLCITLIKYGKVIGGNIKYLLYLIAAMFFVLGFVMEWGIVLLPFMMVTYFLQHKKEERFLGYSAVEGIAFLFRSEIYYFFVFPIIALYNGERGPNKRFNKYFFYVFYPLHLWIIAIVNFMILRN